MTKLSLPPIRMWLTAPLGHEVAEALGRSGERCMVVQIIESGRTTLMRSAREQPDISQFCVLPQYRSADQTSPAAALIHAECLDSFLVSSSAIVKLTAEKRTLYKDLTSRSLALELPGYVKEPGSDSHFRGLGNCSQAKSK
jgi:hypothetical protein